MRCGHVFLLAALIVISGTMLPGYAQQGPAPAQADDLETMVKQMTRIGSCVGPSFSPDGKRVAFVSDLNGIPQVWVVSAEGGWPELVTTFDDPVGRVVWSPEGNWLAVAVAPGGGMNQQVYLVHPDGTGLMRLTEGGKDNNWLGGWSHDGKVLTIASNRGGSVGMNAYTCEVASGKFELVAKNQGIGSLTDLSRDGKYAVLNRMVSRGDNNLYLINRKTGEETLLTKHEGPGTFDGGLFSPDGKTIYLTSNKDRDLIAFAVITLGADGKPGPIEILAERKNAELQEFALTENGKMAALLWNVAGRNELDFFDTSLGKITSEFTLPGPIAAHLTYSRDGFLAFTVGGAAFTNNIWVLDHSHEKPRKVTNSPHAGVNLHKLVQPSLERFKAHDGLELTGWLYRPQGAKGPSPMVLSFHGGPEGQERPRFSADYQALLARGIAVFAPNVRGSAGFGKKFVNLDNGPLRFNAIKDIRACVDHVVAAKVADPKRIGIMGGSYGGYMTMVGLTDYPELFAAGANYFGIVNFATFFEHTEPWMAAISTIEYGDPKTQKKMLADLSPIHKLDRVKAPTLVLHGANDTNVPVVEAEQVVKELKKRGVPVKYVLFPDEGHGFRKTANRIKASVAMVRWFEEHLKKGKGGE